MLNLDKINYVSVGKGGTFSPSSNPAIDTTPEDIDKIFQYLKENDKKKLLLYFHGGLVKTSAGMETAERIVRYARKKDSTHAVCFVWETGLIETLHQNFDTIHKSAFFKKLLIKIIKVAGKELGIDINGFLGGSKGVGSMSDEEINLELARSAPFETTFVDQGKRAPSLSAEPAILQGDVYYETVVTPEVQAYMEEEIASDEEMVRLAQIEKPADEAALMSADFSEPASGARGIVPTIKLIAAAVKITVRVIKRHMRKRDHGFYPTVIEEIFREIYVADLGSWVWGRMKAKAKDMWIEDAPGTSALHQHVGAYFLRKLDEYQQQRGKLSIDMVGHSAGSIVICELLDVISNRFPNITFRKILFMAPACRCELFAQTVLKKPYRFEKFRCFTMSDEFEKKDHLIPFLYPRSLLYFVSGLLEDDSFDAYILGLQRHTNGAVPYDSEQVLKEISGYLQADDHVVYAVTQDTALDGFRSGSVRHGDFDNDQEATLDSVFFLINE